MLLRRLLAFSGAVLISGCLYGARENTDKAVCDLTAHVYDVMPAAGAQQTENHPAAAGASKGPTVAPPADMDIQTTSFMQPGTTAPATTKRLEPPIPNDLPGAEAKLIGQLPKEFGPRQRIINQLYPELPPLAEPPKPLPGPNGQPYTLSELQTVAAGNSPTLRQAASDVEAARGNLIQAKAYPNPTLSWNVQPSSDGSTSGNQGPGIDQTIRFFGKIKLATAAAEFSLRNAELALRRARSDLSTQVRNAYYGLLVAEEAMRVNRSLARFTDAIYRLQVANLRAGSFAAPYEPAGLRAQAYTTRLAYIESIQAYIYAWKELATAIGLRQLPLTAVAGRVDAIIPYYDYDTVLAYALQNHTDVLTARNAIDIARYNLKLAQITPYPDVDVNVTVTKEFVVPPKLWTHTATIGVPLPIWDQNKGNILSAEAALVRAMEEPHRVQMALTTTLATAYTGYKQNLDALEYYRAHILPDQVRYYRGIFQRRQIDQNAAFGDFVAAQQTLAGSVSAYLGILGSLWTSAVSVADVLETDDLFQVGKPLAVPPLPDLDRLLVLPCCHPCAPPLGTAAATGPATCSPVLVIPAQPSPGDQLLPSPRRIQGAVPRTNSDGAAVLIPSAAEVAESSPGDSDTLPALQVQATSQR